jgi:hypothetical protein
MVGTAAIPALTVPLRARADSAIDSERLPKAPTTGLGAGALVIVVEQGSVVPAQAAGSEKYRSHRAFGMSATGVNAIARGSTFVIQGHAQFAETKSDTAPAVGRQGLLELPAIAAPDEVGDSFVQLWAGTQRVGAPVMIATRPAGTIARITAFVPAGDETYLAVGEHFAVVDIASYLAKASNEGLAAPAPTRDQSSLGGGQETTNDVCVRSPFGPGVVEWQGVDPWIYGFSVKAEDGNYLFYSHLPSDYCDGIYNLAWGCGVAIKIPDHCTFYVADWAYCCNAAASVIYGVVRWVYPGSGGEATEWPYCPLP